MSDTELILDLLEGLDEKEILSLAMQSRARLAARWDKRCAFTSCKKEFKGVSRAKYCSSACRAKAYRYRERLGNGDSDQTLRRQKRQITNDKLAAEAAIRHRDQERKLAKLNLK